MGESREEPATRIEFVDRTGTQRLFSLRESSAEDILQGRPVRDVISHPRQKSYSGHFWSATTRSLLVYESRMELSRLLLADFDVNVRWIASQPFRLLGRDGVRSRGSVPDLMVGLRDNTYLVCDVKPADRAAREDVAATFRWTASMCESRGWRYETWTGVAPMYLQNVRLLSAGRRRDYVEVGACAQLLELGAPGMTVGHACSLVSREGGDPAAVKIAALSLMWWQEWVVDLERPLSADAQIEEVVVGAYAKARA